MLSRFFPVMVGATILFHALLLGPYAPASPFPIPAGEDVRSLSLDALIARLPPVGDEQRLDLETRKLVEDPASAEIARRIAEGLDLSGEQWNRALLRTGAIQFRSIWPTELPFAVSVRVPAWMPATTITLVPLESGWSSAQGGTLVPERCGNCARSRRLRHSYQELGRLDPGRHHLEFDVTLERGEESRAQGRDNTPKTSPQIVWKGRMTWDVEVVDRLEVAFPFRRAVELDGAVRRSLRMRYSTRKTAQESQITVLIGLEMSEADAARFSSTSVALEVQLWKDGTLLETETASAVGDTGSMPRRFRFVDPIRLLRAPGNALIEPGLLEGYSVQIRGLPIGVQRLWQADSWWDGTVTASLSDLAKELDAIGR